MKKKKILVISDSPLVPSGVGTQTKYMIEGLLKTGEYQFMCLAGAIKHKDYRLIKVDPWGEDWVIRPVDGYGNPSIIRRMLQVYKPDILWFMTDPRFYTWLWEMEDEIRKSVPMVYYHVWDNYPYPMCNKNFYNSTDVVVPISKVTEDIVKTVAPETESHRIAHAVDMDVFRKHPKEDCQDLLESLDPGDKMVFFWNNRNARRKQSGTLLFWFKEFLDQVGKDKAMLLMHTAPNDPNGPDLSAITDYLNFDEGQILFSTEQLTPLELAKIYSIADCTINISDAEGFGLSTLESLSCETPIIVNMTGGLQEQVTDGDEFFGIGIDASSKTIIGSQDIPCIYEDRISKEDFLNAMHKIYNMTKEERDFLGRKGREHVTNNYSLQKYVESWHDLLKKVHETYGSWKSRTGYNRWEITEL